MKLRPFLLVSFLFLPAAARGADLSAVAHPFILWNQHDAQAIRKRVETEPWARIEYEKLLKEKGPGQTFRNLFRLVVMNDQSVAQGEKKYLLKLVGKDPRNFLGDTGGGRHYDQYLDVLRYDALYDQLSPAERKSLDDTFRLFIDRHLHDETLRFTRTSWLPNMQWPRPMTAHLMALALRDEKLIRDVFSSKGGWKYYFDDYLGDGRFYFEEFGKQYSMLGEMLLWCRGAERLGLNELGFGYKGKGGATMLSNLQSIVDLGYPRVDLQGGMPHYPKVTMGDARGTRLRGAPPYVFQHAIVDGVLPNGQGGETFWIAANMNGRDHENTKVDKMMTPQWFEIAHAKWPDAGFDYFLAQMRARGTDRYIPTLYWGLSPVEASKVKPPEVHSYVAHERGFAMLRSAPGGRDYWEGQSPAVAFQLATYYVHYAHDAFSLLGLYAYNRPIYLNRQISNGYGGGCPWSDSARGHATVMVDNMQWELNETDPKKDHPHWPNPIGEVATRSGFDSLVQFVAARAVPINGTVSLDNRQPLGQATLTLDARREGKQIYPGVDMQRALFLTRDYLFDIFKLSSDRPRLYQWHVHALGQARLDNTWQSTDELDDRLYDFKNREIAKRMADPVERTRYQLKGVYKLVAGDEPWSVSAIQSCALPDVSQSVLGKAWYDRRIGVRVWMLGGAGTAVYAGKSPDSRNVPGREPNKGDKSTLPNEVGGVTLMVERRCPATTFVALHEPFKDGAGKVESFDAIQQGEKGVGVRVIGKGGINDRLLFQYDDGAAEPVTLTDGRERFAFKDRLYLRIGAGRVDASGDLRSMRLRVTNTSKLFVNGVETPARFDDGFLIAGQ